MRKIILQRDPDNVSAFCFQLLIDNSLYAHYSSNNYSDEEQATTKLFEDLGEFIRGYYTYDNGREKIEIINNIDFE